MNASNFESKLNTNQEMMVQKTLSIFFSIWAIFLSLSRLLLSSLSNLAAFLSLFSSSNIISSISAKVLSSAY
jgi:hypothetical protein